MSQQFKILQYGKKKRRSNDSPPVRQFNSSRYDHKIQSQVTFVPFQQDKTWIVSNQAQTTEMRTEIIQVNGQDHISVLWAEVSSSSEEHTHTRVCACVSVQQYRPVHLDNQFKAFSFLHLYLCQAGISGFLHCQVCLQEETVGDRSFLAWKWRSIDVWS